MSQTVSSALSLGAAKSPTANMLQIHHSGYIYMDLAQTGLSARQYYLAPHGRGAALLHKTEHTRAAVCSV